MKKLLTFLSSAFLLVALPSFAQTGTQWTLVQSTLTYHIIHPIHHVSGISHAAKGKGICQSGQCNFLIAAPVKSFQTGDTNRDLHMIEATRGAQFPMIIVRAQFPSSEIDSPTLYAGQTAQYMHVAFQRTAQDGNVRITGTIPATCSDFKIQSHPSSLSRSAMKFPSP